MPQFLSFICQKGGPGKSTMTKITAAYFNQRGIKCLVIDADNPQHTIYEQRHQDLINLTKEGERLPTYEKLKESGIIPYDIISSDVPSSSIQINGLKTSTEYQFVFVDLPGTLNVDGLGNVIMQLDTIIIPCELEHGNITSAMKTIIAIRKLRPTVKICFLWSRLDKNHSSKERQEIEKILLNRFDIYFFKYIAFKSNNFKRMNTLNPAPTVTHEFIVELADIMNSK